MYFRRLFLAVAPLLAAASNVLDLDSDTFDQHVGPGKPPALVEFFAPWCGHCKNLAPTWELLGDAFSHAKDKVSIIKVDADGKGKALGQKYGVSGFPTLKWFPGDGKDPEPYNGGRELDDLAKFVSTKSGVKSSIKPPPPSAIKELTIDNFNEVVMDPSKDVLVTFTAPWCAHCKNMKPELEKVAQTFKLESDVIIANLDGDAKHNKDLTKEYDIRSFPTIFWFPRSPDASPSAVPPFEKKTAIAYDDGRTETDLVRYLNAHAGTKRAVGGGLNDIAGLIPQFEEYVKDFWKPAVDVEKRNELIATIKAEAGEVGEKLKTSGAWYIRALEKSIEKGEEWVDKERKRLETILSKKQLSQEKLDEIKIKANVLGLFKRSKIYQEKAKDEL